MTTSNIALLATQRLSDADNGGGQMTGTIIPDNQADNLFADISREDRTAGRVNLRKAIMMALSADTKTYLGAHAIVATPPADPDVSVLLFSTGSWTDVRTDARNFIESYLVQGPAMQCWLYGHHVHGQRSILVFQKPDRPLPSIGDTIVLDDTTTTPDKVQFVRIESLHDDVQTFTDGTGDFPLRVITLGINTPLTTDFAGAGPQRFSAPASPTLVCQTTVADAAKYYGVTRPTADISAGDLSATVESVYGQLVPATQAEVPITNSDPPGAQTLVATAEAPTVVASWDTGISSTGTWHTRSAMIPGTVRVKSGVSSTLWAVDDGVGNLCSGTITGPVVGSVNYTENVVVITSNIGFTQAVNIFAIPAVVVAQSPYTSQQPVTQATRGYVYVGNLNPVPAPKTLVVSYRALGRWYDLTDDGTGTLAGVTGAGSGVVRYDSGAVSVTLGALPDIGSSVIYAWGQAANYSIRTGDLGIQIPAVSLSLSNPAKPGTVSITWLVGMTTKTVTDNGSGVLSGDGIGTIEYGSGLITLRPTALPSVATGITVAYDTNPATVDMFTPSKSGSDVTITLSTAPVAPKSIRISYALLQPASYMSAAFGGSMSVPRDIHDDGAGGLVDSVYGAIVGSSVNYTTGDVSFNPDLVGNATPVPIYLTSPSAFWNPAATPPAYEVHNVSYIAGWHQTSATIPFINGSTITASATAASATNVSTSDSFPSPAIKIDLTPTTGEPIVPGSIMFFFAGDTFIDRAGSLYRSVSAVTNAGLLAGSIDYTTGIATITSWLTGGASDLTVETLLGEMGNTPIGYLSSRAPGQSIRPASFYLQANRVSDGALISATADADGNWSNTHMVGHIDVSTGFYSVQFGQSVLDSSLTSDDKLEPWYDAGNVDGTGHIWRPAEVVPGTVKFSCVVETFLPLDPTILGIDPVRLPLDGRVQIIRPGDTLVLRNPLTFSMTNPLVASTEYSMPRSGLEDIVLYDSDGVAVDTSNYTTDPSAGTVTTTPGMDLSAYTQPIIATHTQADMVLCIDSQITGQIGWNRPLTNDYPAASSYISSALVAGDLQARYGTLFSQTTWNFNPATLWEDVVQGTSPAAQFDDVNFPIQVIDKYCVTQRWALIFTSATDFQIVGEHYGVIGTGDITHNVAPLNPAYGQPLFIMDWHGFGTGWATGRAIRFNTTGAGAPLWFARTTLAGAAISTDDHFAAQLRWDE